MRPSPGRDKRYLRRGGWVTRRYVNVKEKESPTVGGVKGGSDDRLHEGGVVLRPAEEDGTLRAEGEGCLHVEELLGDAADPVLWTGTGGGGCAFEMV